MYTKQASTHHQAIETSPAVGQSTQVEKGQTQSTSLGRHRAAGAVPASLEFKFQLLHLLIL